MLVLFVLLVPIPLYPLYHYHKFFTLFFRRIKFFGNRLDYTCGYSCSHVSKCKPANFGELFKSFYCQWSNWFYLDNCCISCLEKFWLFLCCSTRFGIYFCNEIA